MTRWLVLSGTAWVFALAVVSTQPGRPAFPGMLDQHPAIARMKEILLAGWQ